MDLELLEAVLNRAAPDLTFTPGWLTGYAAEIADGYTFPTLVENRGGRVDGVVTRGLSQEDGTRIAYFEDTEYAPTVLDIATAGGDVAAQVLMATAALKSTGEPWRFDNWRKHHKPVLLAVTRKVMREHYGRTPLAEIDAVWHRLKAEIEAELHAPVQLKPRRRARTQVPTRAAPRRATRAASPTRPPRGS